MQQEGVDYTKTYSPTVCFESIRIMVAASASRELHMEHTNVTTAFLYAELEEEVYLVIPEGMFERELPGKVFRLLKVLYKIKQSPRMWSLRIDKALSEFGLHRLTPDFCIYYVFEGPDRVLLDLFVHDMFIFGKNMLLKEKYLGEVLLNYRVTNSRAASTRLPPACKLSQDNAPQFSEEKPDVEGIPYRSSLGPY